MAKIVELCGSPGVGKTTIYKDIVARWTKKDKWIPGDKLSVHPNFRSKYIYKFLSYLPQRLKGKIERTHKMKIELRDRFVKQYPQYMNACWNDLSVMQKKTLNGLDLRFNKVAYLGAQIIKFQLLKESETNNIAIMEEGLIHLLDVISFYNKSEEIIQIIEVMPLPDALIYIETDVSENVRRLMRRGEFISYHKLLNTDQLEQLTQQSQERRMLINKVLKEKGMPVLHIDAKAPIASNTDKIISFIEKL